MKNKSIKIFRFFCFLFFLVILIFTIPALIEHYKCNKKIEDFIKLGKYREEHSKNGIEVYIVSRGTNEKESISYNNDKYYLGKNGDIIITNYLSFVDSIPIISELSDFYIGGHASIVFDLYRYESIGVGKSKGVNKIENDILYKGLKEIIGLRLNINDEEILKVKEFVLNQVGKKYNNLYIFGNSDKFYCTDLVTRAYGKEAGLNYKLNHDGFLITTYDILYSDLTDIFFYYKRENGIGKYYILD